MAPRPSVLPFRIGVDISNARRFARYFPLEQTFYDDAIGVPTHRVQLICMLFHKMFTPREQRAFWMRFLRPHSNMETAHNLTTRHLASRWSAKEAVIKAVRNRKLSLLDIEILGGGIAGGGSSPPFAVVLDKRHPPHTEKLGYAKDIYFECMKLCHGRGSFKSSREKSFPSSDTHEETSSLDESDPSHHLPDYTDVEGQVIDISISHDGTYCAAMAIAPIEPIPGDVGGEAAAREPTL